MILDIDEINWNVMIRCYNYILNGLVKEIRRSRHGKGLHLRLIDGYWVLDEPIECENRRILRILQGFDITFDSPYQWVPADMINFMNLLREVE